MVLLSRPCAKGAPERGTGYFGMGREKRVGNQMFAPFVFLRRFAAG